MYKVKYSVIFSRKSKRKYIRLVEWECNGRIDDSVRCRFYCSAVGSAGVFNFLASGEI
jgi:hypothetical protein